MSHTTGKYVPTTTAKESWKAGIKRPPKLTGNKYSTTQRTQIVQEQKKKKKQKNQEKKDQKQEEK